MMKRREMGRREMGQREILRREMGRREVLRGARITPSTGGPPPRRFTSRCFTSRGRSNDSPGMPVIPT
jgi:hypothetical protein